MKSMMVMVVMVMGLLSSPQPAAAANIFRTFSRGFEHQEEIQSTILETGNGWESREVAGKVWVCTGQQQGNTNNNGPVTTTEQLRAFLRLFAYLNGGNSRGQNLPMGKPVSIEVKASPGGGRELNACFFLPEQIQTNPPTPNNNLVYLSRRPAITIYTRRFGGFASDEEKWMDEAQSLQQVLTAEGKHTRSDIQYWNAFDPPPKFWFRRNEVWLVKDTELTSNHV